LTPNNFIINELNKFNSEYECTISIRNLNASASNFICDYDKLCNVIKNIPDEKILVVINKEKHKIKKLLDGIDVDTNVDFIKNKDKLSSMAKTIIYTGPIDEYYNYEFGNLDYNTLRFTKEEYKGDFQGNAVINYADEDVPYIRSVEHKHFYKHGESTKHYTRKNESKISIITYDHPVSFKENPDPFYPIRNEKNSDIYKKYNSIKSSNIIFGGRLGEYKYLDLDATMASAISKCNKFLEI
jgi:UDP-galactopyranose mutase